MKIMRELFDVLFNKNAAIKETEDEYGWPCLCKQCGWYGKSKELFVDNQYYCEDYHPFFCPKCLADEYSIVDIMEEGYTPNFKDKLKSGRNSDIYQKTTLTGPQRDDITFYINKNDVRKYGSQGQQRSTALSLKLSEIELFKKKTGDNPILLLDDVLSELDRSRQNYLIESIGDIQTIITCTGLEEFVENKKADGRIYKINSGKIDKSEVKE